MPGFFVGFGGLGIFAFFTPGEEDDRPERMAAAARERDDAEDFGEEDAGRGAEGRLEARPAEILGGLTFIFLREAGGAEEDRAARERAGAVLSRAAEAREREEAAFEGDVRAEDFLGERTAEDFDLDFEDEGGEELFSRWLMAGLAVCACGGLLCPARVLAGAPAARAGFRP